MDKFTEAKPAELRKKYAELLEENKKLKLENENLRKQLELAVQISREPVILRPEGASGGEEYTTVIGNETSAPVSNQSPPQDKIDLFMSLFRGRDDIYAKRWENKDGRSGYTPVCLNEWEKGICNKPRVKCSACVNKNYAAWGSEAADKHLRGNVVLGIYPMLPDETCYFLAIDFDDMGWQKDVFALKEACMEQNVPIAVERSRSGNGAHAWFFFEDKISAVAARRFGTALLTYAMSKRHEIQFTSYDRLFPNQDTLPKGGLGNLIALPLQLNARKDQNSLFIDEGLAPYADQWKFLSGIRKLNEAEVNSYISLLSNGNELGDLRQSEDDDGKPWRKAGTNSMLEGDDFPKVMNITRANMLYIDKSGFSQKALNTMKRLAAFKNPDFYKAQAMRLRLLVNPELSPYPMRLRSIYVFPEASRRIWKNCSDLKKASESSGGMREIRDVLLTLRLTGNFAVSRGMLFKQCCSTTLEFCRPRQLSERQSLEQS